MFTNYLLLRRISSWAAAVGARLLGNRTRRLHPAVISDHFVFSKAPYAMSHASTIAASGGVLVSAWFGGSLESRPDVSIYVSINANGLWSEPVPVANGDQGNGVRYACWNPVLFPSLMGPLWLFYKVGESPRSWRGMCIISNDSGRSWSKPQYLPDGVLGPAKNKPVQLTNNDLLSPCSTENTGWQVYVERGNDPQGRWQQIGPINDCKTIAAIQPSILRFGDGRLQLLCRTKQGRIAASWSSDDGATWSEMRLTALPNPNSGADALSLMDGRQLLVYNHSSRRRSPLNLALSEDGGVWRRSLVLAQGPGEYSYPAVTQAADGLIHVTYTWNLCRIRHVVIDPAQL